jgi:hypothetical protein
MIEICEETKYFFYGQEDDYDNQNYYDEDDYENENDYIESEDDYYEEDYDEE